MASKPIELPLDEAFQFTPADLAANQAGNLSETQRKQLEKVRLRSVVGMGGFVVVMVFVATLILFLGQRNDAAVLTLIGIFLTVVNALMVGIAVQTYLRINRDLTQPVTHYATQIKRTLRVSGRRPSFILTLDNEEKVFVNRNAFNAIHEGIPYTLHRSAGSRSILSAEIGD